MALLKIDMVDIANAFRQCHHIISERTNGIYSLVNNKSETIAMFNYVQSIATVYNQPGKLFLYDHKDFKYYLEKTERTVYTVNDLSNNTNSLPSDYRLEDLKQTHPNNYQLPAIEGLTTWVLLDCGDAVRYYAHCDNNLYGSRAAYISKSARVRIRDNQWETVGGRSSEYGLDVDNMKACDEVLVKLGFKYK